MFVFPDDGSPEAFAWGAGEEDNLLSSPVTERSRHSAVAAPPAPEDEPDPPCAGLTAEMVFREHAGRVFSLARRMLGNDTDAEDVTQDVLVQVLRKLDTFRGEAALTTWLHRVTANAAFALRRRRAARRECPLGATPEYSPEDTLDTGVAPTGTRRGGLAPDEQALAHELRQLIESAIKGLPWLYRDVYVLADVDGLSNAEIGATLSLSLPAVKGRLRRARLMMRDALAPFFEEQTI